MNTFDIISAITKALKVEFPDAKMYAEEVKQGLIAPAFVVFSIQSEQEPYPSGRYHRVNPFVIHYFPADKVKARRECADVAERMIWALEYIEMEPDEAPLRGTNIRHEFRDEVLHFFINYDVFLRKVEEKDPMETLHEEHMLRD